MLFLAIMAAFYLHKGRVQHVGIIFFINLVTFITLHSLQLYYSNLSPFCNNLNDYCYRTMFYVCSK